MSKEARFLVRTVLKVRVWNRRNDRNENGLWFRRSTTSRISLFLASFFDKERGILRLFFEKCLAFAFLFLLTVISFNWVDRANAATYQTTNFIVDAESDDLARKIGDTAERFRANLSTLWLDRVLPNWYAPCQITVKAGEALGAGGETVYTVADGQVFDWKMSIQGSEERLLDSVLPHEITHTIVASYLLKPAPRWIDEGMATSVEANVERTHYRTMLATFLHTKKGIAFNDMVATREYPADLMPFYSQSFSVCEYLILVGGRRRLIEFAKLGAETNDWNAAVRRYYDCRSLGDLQLEWLDWVARWDSANRPIELPTTRKLRDFDAWSREETALANASQTNGVSNGVRLVGATIPASGAGAIKSAIAMERANNGAKVESDSRLQSSYSNSNWANDGTGDLNRWNERANDEPYSPESTLASTNSQASRFIENASELGSDVGIETASRDIRIRNWGRGANENTSVRGQEKDNRTNESTLERNERTMLGLQTQSQPKQDSVPSAPTSDSIRVSSLEQTTSNGVKWRSGAGCLVNGAGSATRKTNEKR